jgi:hypothetical protein
MKMEKQNTNSKEGVEVLQQVPFEDEKLGKGQFTSKVYHLQRFVCNLFLDFFIYKKKRNDVAARLIIYRGLYIFFLD